MSSTVASTAREGAPVVVARCTRLQRMRSGYSHAPSAAAAVIGVIMHSVVSTAGFTFWGADGPYRDFAGSWEDGALTPRAPGRG